VIVDQAPIPHCNTSSGGVSCAIAGRLAIERAGATNNARRRIEDKTNADNFLIYFTVLFNKSDEDLETGGIIAEAVGIVNNILVLEKIAGVSRGR
jgi:hypothetical protein